MIELIDFGKDYGDFTAVSSLNLKIDAGEMYGFIGPNGAGKSTTIRFLATLIKATVPMSVMLTYEQTLTSHTGGRGSYHMEFSHYDEVPGHLQGKIIATSRAGRGGADEAEHPH